MLRFCFFFNKILKLSSIISKKNENFFCFKKTLKNIMKKIKMFIELFTTYNSFYHFMIEFF